MFWASLRLLITNVVARPALVVLIMIARYLSGPGNYIAHLEPHSEVMGRGEGEREHTNGLKFCFYWSKGWLRVS